MELGYKSISLRYVWTMEVKTSILLGVEGIICGAMDRIVVRFGTLLDKVMEDDKEGVFVSMKLGLISIWGDALGIVTP